MKLVVLDINESSTVLSVLLLRELAETSVTKNGRTILMKRVMIEE